MRKFLFLFALVIFSLVATTGYSDSGTEKASTYQVAEVSGLGLAILSEIEIAYFDLNSPWLGKTAQKNIFLYEKSMKGYIRGYKAPPDMRIAKIRLRNIR